MMMERRTYFRILLQGPRNPRLVCENESWPNHYTLLHAVEGIVREPCHVRDPRYMLRTSL